MSLTRAVAAVGVAFAIAFVILTWQSRDSAATAQLAVSAGDTTTALSSGAVSSATAPGRAARPSAPSLPDEPFRGEDLAITSDGPEAPMVELRSSARNGRDLSIEIAAREPVAEGKPVFATVSVSDGLGNTIMDCTWRDIQLADDARKLDCELPPNVELPLTISGHQRSAPSFVETPTVVAVDRGMRP